MNLHSSTSSVSFTSTVSFLIVFFLSQPLTLCLGQIEQTPGVTVVAKRHADLRAEENVRQRSSIINVDKVKEFDKVFGTCVNEDGETLADVSIQIYGRTQSQDGRKDSTELLAAAVTEEDGIFEFENLQSKFKTHKFDSYLHLVARKAGYATTMTNSLVWDSEEHRIKLKNAAIVKGFIKNEIGEPVANAAVSFYNPLKSELPNVYATTTDEDGKFEIDDYHKLNSVPSKTIDGKSRGSSRFPLSIAHPDYGNVAVMIDRTPNLFFITITRGAKFVGRTVDESGKPIANCWIAMQSHNGEPHIWFETESGEDGKFQFTKLPNIKANLFFKTDELLGKAIEVNGEQGSETDLGDLKLVKPVLVKGVVIDDATDEPIQLDENLYYSIGWHGPERPKTSAGISGTKIRQDGTFECRFFPGVNYPYVSSGYLQMSTNPYKGGLNITQAFKENLTFRVTRRVIED